MLLAALSAARRGASATGPDSGGKRRGGAGELRRGARHLAPAPAVITGEFDTSLAGRATSWCRSTCPGHDAGAREVLLRPARRRRRTRASARLDLGLCDARRAPGALCGREEFRGWGGSSHPDVTSRARASRARPQYLAKAERPRPGQDDARLPAGPIRPGEWAAELGVAAVVTQARRRRRRQGRAGASRSTLSSDPAFAAEPYRPHRYDERRRARPGWYAGDCHVHAEHSSLGDATMRETFDYAFRPARRRRRGSRLHHALRLRHRRRGARSAATSPTTRAS